ncbi:MAG: nucleotide exchange factor GrpE [Deltaproteobacteria bacterium]|nr:nucleotide exchange factor GrpE [Deltaproteobacteria bacterium]
MSDGSKDKPNTPENKTGDSQAYQEAAGPQGSSAGSPPEPDSESSGATGEATARSASGTSASGPAGDQPESMPGAAGLAEELAAANDNYLRLHAEFENTKKRLAKHHAESLRYALTPVLKDLIVIMDNLERAVEHARKEPDPESTSLLEGVEMVQRQLQSVFDKYGLTRMEAAGKPFDPNLHEGIHVVETLEVAPDTIMQEFQVGYLLHERVVRPAMVSVAKRPADAPKT